LDGLGPEPGNFQPGHRQLLLVDLHGEAIVPRLDQKGIPDLENLPVVAEGVNVEHIEEGKGLVEKIPLVFRTPGNKLEVFVGEGDAGETADEVFPVPDRFTVDRELFPYAGELHRDFDGGVSERAAAPGRKFLGAMTAKPLLVFGPKGGAVAKQINPFEEIGFSLAIGACEDDLFRTTKVDGLVGPVAELVEPYLFETHLSSSPPAAPGPRK
jgi:hypothetical protein